MKKITTTEQLRDLLGRPHPLTEQKIYPHLNAQARDFLEAAPLYFIASHDRDGRVTVSPKGDAPGLLKIVDDETLILPDRPGNKLLYGLENILQTGQVGLLFLRPGTEETLRINGRAELFQDARIGEELSANGRPARVLIQVKVEQCFFHCAKAFKRSSAWQPEGWPAPFKVSFGKEIAGQSRKGGKLAAKAVEVAVNQAVKVDYKTNL